MRHATTIGMLILAVSGYGGARASCPSPRPSVLQSLERADAVFLGQIESRWPRLSRQYDYCFPLQTYHFRVLQSWKGEIGATAVLADTGANTDVLFKPGGTYLVYAKRHRDLKTCYSASICTRTRPFAEAAEDLTELGTKGQLSGVVATDPESRARRLVRLAWTTFLAGVARVVNWTHEGPSDSPVRIWLQRAALVLVALSAAVAVALLARRGPRAAAFGFLGVVLVFLFIIATLGYPAFAPRGWWRSCWEHMYW